MYLGGSNPSRKRALYRERYLCGVQSGLLIYQTDRRRLAQSGVMCRWCYRLRLSVLHVFIDPKWLLCLELMYCAWWLPSTIEVRLLGLRPWARYGYLESVQFVVLEGDNIWAIAHLVTFICVRADHILLWLFLCSSGQASRQSYIMLQSRLKPVPSLQVVRIRCARMPDIVTRGFT